MVNLSDFCVRLSRQGGINPQNTKCISRHGGIKIFAFLELEQIPSFMGGHYE